MTCRLLWYGRNRNRYRITIWRKFWRIQWHVIPEPRITLQGAATWWIHCHDSRATCHIAGCSHLAKSLSWSCHIAGCKNSIRHIENRFSPYIIFLMQFRLWRAAAFVSSPIHLFVVRLSHHNKDYGWMDGWMDHCELYNTATHGRHWQPMCRWHTEEVKLEMTVTAKPSPDTPTTPCCRAWVS